MVEMKIQTIHKLKLPFDYKIKGLNWICNRITEKVENHIIRTNEIYGQVGRKEKDEETIILSMTTYPARENVVPLTVKSLINQSFSVDKFIIWLALEQYPDKRIPASLMPYLRYGVQVKFCDDLRSHKKYYYAMQQNPDAVIITADDDVIYPEDTIEKLMKAHRKYPNTVICNQARWMELGNEKFEPYSRWKTWIPSSIQKPNFGILPIGCGAVLYPPDSLDRTHIFDKTLIQSLAPNGDDLWLKYMAVLNNTRAMVSCKHQRGLSDVITKEKIQRLSDDNVKGGANNFSMSVLDTYFPEVKEKILVDVKDMGAI